MNATIALPAELVAAIASAVADELERRGTLSPAATTPYLTVPEAAAYLRCSPQSIYDRISQGALEPRRDGRRVLLDRRHARRLRAGDERMSVFEAGRQGRRMSAVVERAFAAAVERDYSGPGSRALLLRMALDADHETGENCVTSLVRIHAAAGYADDGERFRTARRTVKRLEGDGVIRCDLEVAGERARALLLSGEAVA